MKYQWIRVKAFKKPNKWQQMMLGIVPFKYQWRITWEYNGLGVWEPYEETFESRRAAREFKQTQFFTRNEITGRSAYTCYRNIKMSRRLVAVNWEHYEDSFTWNRGCGG